MTDTSVPRSNRYSLVKNVSWWSDCFWGSHEWLAQEMVGMTGPRKIGSKNELDTKKYPIEDLSEYFKLEELEGGRLGFTVFLDEYCGTPVASFETDLRYHDDLDDETLAKIIDDYVAYVHSLPLADPSQAITAEEREQGLNDFNTFMFDDLLHGRPELLQAMLLKDMRQAREREEKPWKYIEF